MLWKCCMQYASKFGKVSSGHGTGKGQFSFQSQRKAMPKNVQTTAQLHSSQTPAKQCSKIFKPGFNSTWKCELPDVQAGLRKVRGTKDQSANICWIIERAREFQKTIYFCFTDYAKVFDCVDNNTLWKILIDGNTRPPYQPPEKLYAGQEATVRTRCGTMDWFQIGKGICQGYIFSSYLFNLYAEYIMQNAGLDEAQACQEKYQ